MDRVATGSVQGPSSRIGAQCAVLDLRSTGLTVTLPSSFAQEEDTQDTCAVVAFTTDAQVEQALREGLRDYPRLDVWPNDPRSVRTALTVAVETVPGLVVMDLDGRSYPAGAIHELGAYCVSGTVVVALASQDSARQGREVLLAGVSEYLVKPVSPASLREAAMRARAPATHLDGRLVAFVGTGGSGATTVAAVTSLLAAEHGRYVSVLDLNRVFAALPFALDVEPAVGLDELLHAAGVSAPSEEMLDAVRATRSERIAIYGYRFGPSVTPTPPVAGVRWILEALRRRSHLVLVDGFVEPSSREVLLAESDVRVLVVEPTATGVARATRLLGRVCLADDERSPAVLVQSHTRRLRPATGAKTLLAAGMRPDVTVPFDASVPTSADWGWPDGQVPRAIARPLHALVDRLLAPVQGTADLPVAQSA